MLKYKEQLKLFECYQRTLISDQMVHPATPFKYKCQNFKSPVYKGDQKNSVGTLQQKITLLTNGPMDQKTNERMEKWTNGQMDKWTKGPVVQWKNGPLNQWTIGPMDQ